MRRRNLQIACEKCALGVYVERMQLRNRTELHEVPLDNPALQEGWWTVERNGLELRRWTNGDAVLPLQPTDGPAVLEICAGSSSLAYVLNIEAPRVAA